MGLHGERTSTSKGGAEWTELCTSSHVFVHVWEWRRECGEKTLHMLTVHGEFLRGGGKRGLLSNAELRWPLDWPSTLNVAPLPHKHIHYTKRRRKTNLITLRIHMKVLKYDCKQKTKLSEESTVKQSESNDTLNTGYLSFQNKIIKCGLKLHSPFIGSPRLPLRLL